MSVLGKIETGQMIEKDLSTINYKSILRDIIEIIKH